MAGARFLRYKHRMADTPTPQRDPAWAILFLFAIPVLVGPLLAPPAYHLARWVGEAFALGDSLRNPMFERVASRCVQLVALLLLVPCSRWSGQWPDVRAGLRPTPERIGDFARGLLFGCASMFLVYLAGWSIGAYRLDPDLVRSEVLRGAALFSIAALCIGIFEEIFFRGFVFGALRQRRGFLFAAVLSSAIFSLMHFLRPRMPVEIVDPAWYAGYALLPHLFGKFVWVKDWDFMLMLFLMGLCLCGFYRRRGNLFLIMGLHAGWVWGMAVASDVFDRNAGMLDFWFSRGDLVSKGALAILVMAVFCAFALRPRRL